MKANLWIVLGLVIILASSFSAMQIVDTTKPEILWSYETSSGTVPLNGAMYPQGNGNYTSIDFIYVLVRDLDSGISEIEYSLGKTRAVPTKYSTLYYGWVVTYLSADYKEWQWHWGEQFPDKTWSGIFWTWQIWGLNLSDPIDTVGQYSFWFKVFNGAGEINEPTGMPNTFQIVTSKTEPLDQPPPPSDVQPPPQTEAESTVGKYDIPILFFAIGSIAIIYGFTQKKRKTNRKGSATPLVLILMLLCIGVIFGYILASGSGVTAPHEHQAVINSMIVKDTAFNLMLAPVCVQTSESIWNEQTIISLATFEDGRVYPHSTWLWKRYGDTELCMTLWGPGEDQNTILVEIGRLGSNPFEVKVSGITKLSWGTAQSNPETGYYVFEVQLKAYP